jgi:hypothetical protein
MRCQREVYGVNVTGPPAGRAVAKARAPFPAFAPHAVSGVPQPSHDDPEWIAFADTVLSVEDAQHAALDELQPRRTWPTRARVAFPVPSARRLPELGTMPVPIPFQELRQVRRCRVPLLPIVERERDKDSAVSGLRGRHDQ